MRIFEAAVCLLPKFGPSALIGHAAEHGQLEPRRVMRMDHVDHACLTKIPGIGPWTADMIGIFIAGIQTSGPTVIWWLVEPCSSWWGSGRVQFASP